MGHLYSVFRLSTGAVTHDLSNNAAKTVHYYKSVTKSTIFGREPEAERIPQRPQDFEDKQSEIAG